MAVAMLHKSQVWAGVESNTAAATPTLRDAVYCSNNAAGGIAPKLLERIKSGGFMEAFTNPSGRQPFHKILKATPLFVITNEKVGVLGTVQYAVRSLQRGS